MLIEGIFQIQVPLPNNPLRMLNSYLVLPKADQPDGKALLIDTGFDHPEAYAAITAAIENLGLSLSQIDILATHLHSDHSGQLTALRSPSSRCYAGKIDGQLINAMTTENYWHEFFKLYGQIGLADDQLSYLDHPGYIYCPKVPVDFVYLNEGDVLSYGDFNFSVIDVPGHTPGQIVLWEAEKSILISADHILDQITPNISFWGFEYGDSLGIYLKSLNKIKALNARVALPSHRSVIYDVNGRIDVLADHHEERLAEVLSILQKSKTALTARAVAAQMHWSVRQNDFEAFPSPQKWFASAEAMSHLVHLEVRGLIAMTQQGEAYCFKAL